VTKSFSTLVLCAALAAGCTTTTRSRSFYGDPVPPTVSLPTRAWRAAPEGLESVTVGWVVQFDPAEGEREGYWSVRNAWHQELGMVDALGRAWRFEPHIEEARLVGAGTVAEGVGSILESAAGVTLLEVPMDQLRQGADGS
jgi:hypothetical protein